MMSAPAALALGYGAGWWWMEHSGWYGKRERRLLVHCFLAWLELWVGDPKAKLQDFGLTVVSTVRTSGFTLMGDLSAPLGTARNEAEDRARNSAGLSGRGRGEPPASTFPG